MYIEVYQLFTMSTVSELYNMDFTLKQGKISSSVTVMFAVMNILLSIMLYKYSKLDRSKFREVINGLKQTRWARYYFNIFMLRRLLSIVLTIALVTLHLDIKIFLFIVGHIA